MGFIIDPNSPRERQKEHQTAVKIILIFGYFLM